MAKHFKHYLKLKIFAKFVANLKQFTLVNYGSRVVIWGIFKSGMTLES